MNAHLIRYQTNCYDISGSSISINNGIIIIDLAKYRYKFDPSSVVTINGINFKPDPVPGFGATIGLYFKILETTATSITGKLVSNSGRFDSHMIEKVQLCYMLVQNPRDYHFEYDPEGKLSAQN